MTKKISNYDLSKVVFTFLKKSGVSEIIVCAGARNAPMLMALQKENFKIYSFFEERSAAFFALGLIKARQKPVAIVTTSGTAAAELLPAAIEATYQGLPLVLITADRPKAYRGTGAPQSIEQVGLYSSYVEESYDLDVSLSQFKFHWSQTKPIHLNVCYDEPLIDQPSGVSPEIGLQKKEYANTFYTKVQIDKFRKPLLIVSELAGKDIESVEQYVLKHKLPVYAECLSQLRQLEKITPYILNSSDTIVKKLFKAGHLDSAIRVGGVPTLRFWRDLEMDFISVPVMSFSHLPYTGLARSSQLQPLSYLPELFDKKLEFSQADLDIIFKIDRELVEKKEQLIEKYPLSEAAMVRYLSVQVASAPIYVGNSLPIRHWDQFAQVSSTEVAANRGANGIDGQISTYLGWSEKHLQSYCLVGDLTALYDLAALGLSPQLSQRQRTICVLNNYGGQIFSRVFNNSAFINAHQLEFSAWAQLWGWKYHRVTQALEFWPADQNLIVEINPDAVQSSKFWQEWDDVCRG